MGPSAAAPEAPEVRTTWVAALFALMAGVLLVYVPYEFSAPVFRHIYPYARELGTAFLAGALLLGVSALYPEWPRALDATGRLLLLGALGVYWWESNVRSGAVTGTVLYTLMILCVALESPHLRRTRPASTFLPFVAADAFGLGSMMLLSPGLFGEAPYRYLWPVLQPLGALFVSGAVLLTVALWRRHAALRRGALFALIVSFGALAVALFATSSWTGTAVYLAVMLGIAAVLGLERGTVRPGLRWRLWRGMVIASCMPLIALGAVACVLMQRSVEELARREAQTATDAEIEWLGVHFEGAREALAAHARLPDFAGAVRARDREAVELSLEVLQHHTTGLEAVFLVDAEGEVLARSEPGVPRLDNQSTADFFRGARQPDVSHLYVSVPYLGLDGERRVALAAPVREGGALLGVLAGTVSLPALSGHRTLASQHYSIQLVDVRTGALVRETSRGDLGMAAWLPAPLESSFATATRGSHVGPDLTGHQVSVTWAPVPETPWLLVVTQPAAATYRAVTKLGMGAAAFVSVGALLALVLSRFVASEVTRRVARLRLAATALAEGDLAVRVRAEGNDELDALGEAFDRMADQVQAAEVALRRKNELLESAVATRDQFLSLASHELRTPLTPLKATAQTLRLLLTKRLDALEPQRVLQMLDRMDRQTDRLALLVSDMLDTARIQAGRFVLAPAPTDLGALVEDVVERHRAAHPHVAERLRVVRPEAPVVGLWDAPRLEQVVVNLLENALRYSPEGGEVLLSLRDDGEAVQLSVTDRGIGIPPDCAARLFEPFYRAANAADRHFGGLGLGLHICREIAGRHGGRIWGESEGVGKGSTFHLWLPRTQSAETAPVTAEPTDGSRAA